MTTNLKKNTTLFSKMEDDLTFFENRGQPPHSDDAFPNLTEGWLSSSKILLF